MPKGDPLLALRLRAGRESQSRPALILRTTERARALAAAAPSSAAVMRLYPLRPLGLGALLEERSPPLAAYGITWYMN